MSVYRYGSSTRIHYSSQEITKGSDSNSGPKNPVKAITRFTSRKGQISRLRKRIWAGRGLNFIFIVYFLLDASFQIRLFIEIIQVWLLPDLETWPLALVLLLLVYYIVAGGFRVIVGICMFSLTRNITLITLYYLMVVFISLLLFKSEQLSNQIWPQSSQQRYEKSKCDDKPYLKR
ncbi:GerAB/ArcD/ProY family transporter [Paenibacillus sp. V4I9]|uniref:GerAB/ArcD/ProY family transporter n=1 Tax=Paenibacillus sp. V4I9 TaxID=3042308 RepID=UPI0035942348